MSDYTKTTDFAAKDALASGDANKLIRGADFGTEFDNLEVAVNSKADSADATLTGTTSFENLSDGTTAVTGFTTDDTMAADSDALIPTQGAVKAYVDTSVAAAGDVVADTTPQLGGDLDLNGSDITGTGNVNITGDVSLTGTVDGRDVAADGTKLDGIEAGATGDQTATEIRALVDSALDSNVYTDAEKTKLSNIEANADVTDTTNVVASLTAGTNITIAGDGTIDTVGVASDENFTTAYKNKLEGIESGADVTDTDNVVASLTAGTNITIAADGTISASGSGGGGAVDSVNSQTGTVVLDADDIDDTSTTHKFTTAGDITKLAGIETGATADMTGAEIKTAYESESDTNAFTDAEKTKLSGIEAGATADQTASEIRALVESATDSNVFTDADHTKLDAIESGATADQTASEIRALVDSATDSNVFTDADHTKLDGIEAGADVTDTTNVVASLTAGTNITIAADGTISSTATGTGGIADVVEDTTPQLGGALDLNSNDITGTGNINTTGNATISGTAQSNALNVGSTQQFTVTDIGKVTTSSYVDAGSYRVGATPVIDSSRNIQNVGDITLTGTVDGRDVAADGTKLDGIETGADVTDTANVTAAGAVMDSELTDEAAVKALNQGVATTDSPTFAGLTTTANVSFGDNDKAIFGAGSDLQIYHDGSNSYITDSGTGNLRISGTLLQLNDASFNKYLLGSGDSVTLYNADSPKLATTSSGIDVTGTAVTDGVTVAGNILLQAEGNELQFNTSSTPVNKIYSDDTYTSNGLTISADNGVTLKSTSNYLLLDDTGTNEMVLNVDSGERMRVTSTGIDVTGTVTADGLTIDGNATVNGNNFEVSSTTPNVRLTETDVIGENTQILQAGGTMRIRSASDDYVTTTERMRIDHGSGDISFYNDAGTSQDLYWDASTSRLGLGTTAPSSTLDVAGTVTADGLTVDGDVSAVNGDVVLGGNNNEVLVATNTNLNPFYIARGYVTTETLAIGVDDSDAIIDSIQDERYGGYKFQSTYSGTGTRTRMEIGQNTGDISFYDDAGTSQDFYWDASTSHLGIGTTSPGTLLHLSSSDPRITLTDTDAGGNFQIRNTSGVAYISTLGAHPMLFSTNSAEAMRIDSSGRVGIGTTSPSATLHAKSASTEVARVESTGTTGSYLTFEDADTTAGQKAWIGADGDLFKFYSNNSTLNMTMTTDGNVGIGTQSPSRPLHVEISSGTTPTVTGIGMTALVQNNSSTASDAGYGIISGTAANGSLFFGDADDADVGRIQYEHNTNAMTFQTNASERLRIDSSGNVGIGTDAPSSTLDVNGTLTASGLTYPSADGTAGQVLTTDGSGTLSFADKVYVNIRDFYALTSGGTDWSPAFQAAIDSLAVNDDTFTGGVIFVPRGDYPISSTIDVDTIHPDGLTSITIQGEGMHNTRINCSVGFTGEIALNVKQATYCSFKDFQVRGADNCDYGIRFLEGSEIQVERVFCQQFINSGFYVQRCFMMTFEQCRAKSCKTNFNFAPDYNLVTTDTYTGNGATTAFAYNFKIFEDSDLRVFVDGTAQELGTDYTVSGAGNASGGTVTFTSAPTSAADGVVIRTVGTYNTSINCRNCYSLNTKAVGQGFFINDMAYSSFVACGSDFASRYGYRIGTTAGVTFDGCGNEKSGRAGFFFEASNSIDSNSLLNGTRCSLNDCFSWEADQDGAGYGSIYSSQADTSVIDVSVRNFHELDVTGATSVASNSVTSNHSIALEKCKFQNALSGVAHVVSPTAITKVGSTSVTAANTPVLDLKSVFESTNSYSGVLHVTATNGSYDSTSVLNTAAYVLLVTKGAANSGVVEIAKNGLTAGSGASWPSFTWSLDTTNNQLEASPVGSTSGNFHFYVSQLGGLHAS